MGRARRFCAWICAFFFLGPPSLSFAYTPTLGSDGVSVRWKGNPRLQVAGNPLNKNGVSAQDFYESVVRGLQRWKTASNNTVSFDYWQGTDPQYYTPNSNFNGLSSIYFASNGPQSGTGLSSNVLGLTQVWYNTTTGEIMETDIVLNDLSYHFSTDPRDTSGYGSAASNYSGVSSGGGRNVYIENVLTHELGHAFGLSHSGGLQSTMLFMESPEQAYLGCDDQIGIHALYPSSADGVRGGIAGTVTVDSGTSGSGSPLFGAHVLAISRQRGVVMASAVTDKQGKYRIGALEPGTYFLLVEPFFAGAAALSGYYDGMTSRVCNGKSFSRTLLTDTDPNMPKPIVVNAQSTAQAPIAVHCIGGSSGAAVSSFSAVSSGSAYSFAPSVYDGVVQGSKGGFGVVDRFSGSNALTYELQSVSGRLEIHALSYSLYSPVHPSMVLLDKYGNEVSAERIDNVYEGLSGYVNFDSALTVTDLPPGDYRIQVSPQTLSASLYPAGPLALDTVPFVLITGSVNEATPSLAQTVPVNGRCRMEENFASYVSPPGNPPRHSSNDESGGAGGCGTVSSNNGGSGGRGPGAIAGWFLPWVLMVIIGLRVRRATVTLYS